jgi:pimeloyl-ACP methyl ester carboxylesterase
MSTGKRVLFIGGLNKGNESWYGFNDLKAELVRRGYNSRDLLFFSYRGGYVNGLGEYAADGYTCSELGGDDYGRVTRFLSNYKEMRPDVSFALVGHSYGGLVAYETIGTPSLPVSSVVTVDSPLKRIGDLRTIWGELLSLCAGSNI